jgi:hypothetical protein
VQQVKQAVFAEVRPILLKLEEQTARSKKLLEGSKELLEGSKKILEEARAEETAEETEDAGEIEDAEEEPHADLRAAWAAEVQRNETLLGCSGWHLRDLVLKQVREYLEKASGNRELMDRLAHISWAAKD